MNRMKFRAVFVRGKKRVISINSFTIQEMASYQEHEWEFSDGSTLPSNDVEEGDLEYIQYTGLKDKNGVEIYEGDIVVECGIKRLIEYGFCEVDSEGATGDYAYGYNLYCDCSNIEIIGNIYENPDLLNSKPQ